MLTAFLLKPINHVLIAEDWARSRLRAFSGQAARLACGDWPGVVLTVTEEGLLEPGAQDQPIAVTVRLPDDAPARLLSDRAGLFSAARIEGSAEFAETLAFVLRNLRWDVEHDLSLLVGDIVARRTVQFARQVGQSSVQGAGRLAQALAEFLGEEQAGLANRGDVERFSKDVDTLRDDVARIQKRLERLLSAPAKASTTRHPER